MWTIGRSQRVEEKKYRPIVRKLRYKKCKQKNSIPTACMPLKRYNPQFLFTFKNVI